MYDISDPHNLHMGEQPGERLTAAGMADEFREAISYVVTSYQAERISAESAIAAIAAILADDESQDS